VHCDIAEGDPAMRDSCRFHFGFTVPFVAHFGTAGVIEAVATSAGDLGLVKVESSAAAGAWWQDLLPPSAPKIIARLPFVERPDHPASLPLFVVAKPLTEAVARDVVLYALDVARWRDSLPAGLATVGVEILGNAAKHEGLSLLIAAPGSVTDSALREACAKAGAKAIDLVEIGSHAARFDLTKSTSLHRSAGMSASE
jgi:hypothetical protein